MIPDGVWKVVGPPSCGKSRYVRAVCEKTMEEGYPECEWWPYSPFGKGLFLKIVLCIEPDVREILPWFRRHIVAAAIDNFCSKYSWAATFPIATPSETKIRLIKKRLQSSIDTTRASLNELESFTLSPLKREDLAARRVALSNAIEIQTAAIQALDEKGRHEDASRAFGLRSNLMAEMRMVTGAIEDHERSNERGSRRPSMERSLVEATDDLAKAEKLTTGLRTLQERLWQEVKGYTEELLGIKVVQGSVSGRLEFPDRQLSSTEERGVKLAVALAVKGVTRYPWVLCEDDHVPPKASRFFTGEIHADQA